MLIQDLGAVAPGIMQMQCHVLQSVHDVFYCDIHVEVMECVRALENCVYSVDFAGHRAFAWQTPNDVFCHDGTQQIAVAAAESAYETLRNDILFLLCHSGPPGNAALASVDEIGFLKSEHGVFVPRRLWYGLNDIPMRDDFAVLEPENVDDGVAVLSKKARVVAVKQDVVSVRKNAFDFTARVGIIFGNPFDVVSKSIEPVCGKRRMLCVSFAAIEADRRLDISLNESFLIKTDNGLLVLFQFLDFGRHEPSLAGPMRN
jgi:hypothetical protein